MKLRYLILVPLLGCTTPKPTFPYETTKVIDPINPSKEEKLYRQNIVKSEDIQTLKCLRTIYKSDKTLLITQHCVGNNEGWYWGERYFDKNKDNLTDKWCNVAGTTIVGGFSKKDKWDCHTSKLTLSEILDKAKKWYKDPNALW